MSGITLICDHCGASGGHGGDECPVKAATRRMLEPPEPAPVGRLHINGAYVGRVDGLGNLEGGELYANADGIVRWVSNRRFTADRTRPQQTFPTTVPGTIPGDLAHNAPLMLEWLRSREGRGEAPPWVGPRRWVTCPECGSTDEASDTPCTNLECPSHKRRGTRAAERAEL